MEIIFRISFFSFILFRSSALDGQAESPDAGTKQSLEHVWHGGLVASHSNDKFGVSTLSCRPLITMTWNVIFFQHNHQPAICLVRQQSDSNLMIAQDERSFTSNVLKDPQRTNRSLSTLACMVTVAHKAKGWETSKKKNLNTGFKERSYQFQFPNTLACVGRVQAPLAGCRHGRHRRIDKPGDGDRRRWRADEEKLKELPAGRDDREHSLLWHAIRVLHQAVKVGVRHSLADRQQVADGEMKTLRWPECQYGAIHRRLPAFRSVGLTAEKYDQSSPKRCNSPTSRFTVHRIELAGCAPCRRVNVKSSTPTW